MIESPNFDIIVLDSGLNTKHPEIAKYNDIHYKYFYEKENKLLDDFIDICGHGTGVVGIIKQESPLSSILSIRIFDEVEGIPICSESKLINTLEYIYSNIEPAIINISCDIVEPNNLHELSEICLKLKNKGFVLVAAHENNGALTYPAGLPSVIGVATDSFRSITEPLEVRNDKIINIIDAMRQLRVPWLNNQYKLVHGSSFLCAKITALASLYNRAGATNTDDILKCFIQHYSFNDDKRFDNKPHLPNFTIKKAIAFPFNKEMHSVIRFADELYFQLVDIYDIKQTFRVGCYTQELLKDPCSPNYIIKNVENIDWNSFDTLILGCVFDLIKLIGNKDFICELIHEALSRNKNIYAFEDISILGFEQTEKIFFPIVKQNNIPPYRGGRLFRTAIPIVGVFGTGSQQGKFTLQMKLRKEFKKIECSIGHIGSEPNAHLFGIDYIYPMGHNGIIEASEFEQLLHINDLLRRVCEKEPDIIIVGSQKGTVPEKFGNLLSYCTQTYPFIDALKPDFIFLTVLITDSIDFIKRTILFLESLSKSVTIALVLFPLCNIDENGNPIPYKRKITEDEFLNFKSLVENKLKIPLLRLDSENTAKKLIELLLKQFK